MIVNKPVIGIAAAVIVAAAGTWYYLHSRHAAPPATPSAAQLPAAAEPPAESSVQHPLFAVQGETASREPLPALADSDAALLDALGTAAGAAEMKDHLLPGNIIRHVVVTLDNLPRQKVAVDKRPVPPAEGSFAAEGDEVHATLDPKNFARYQPLVRAVSKIDMHALAAVYVRFYPLFQQAYLDLGYPNGYFNDRVVQVIDTLLATPEPKGPIELVRPNVMYLYADPQLESRPAGQKLLLRMGPDNAAAIKLKLKELRTAVTVAPPQR